MEQMVEDLLRNVNQLPAKDRAFILSLDERRGLHGQLPPLTGAQRRWVRDVYLRETQGRESTQRSRR